MNGVVKDIRYALRSLLKRPACTLISVITLALGAQRVRVIRLVLIEGTVLAFIGGLVGLGGAYLVGRTMQTTLFGVPALDVRAFGAVFFLLLISAWLACLVPAWRASRVEPLDALRYE